MSLEMADRTEPPRVPPEEMEGEELQAFVRRALLESKRVGVPRDLRLWWEASRRITDRDLRRILR